MISDKHVEVIVFYEIPTGVDILNQKKRLLAETKNPTKGCLYFGFAHRGDMMLSREGYKDAVSFLDPDIQLEKANIVSIVGRENVKVKLKTSRQTVLSFYFSSDLVVCFHRSACHHQTKDGSNNGCQIL